MLCFVTLSVIAEVVRGLQPCSLWGWKQVIDGPSVFSGLLVNGAIMWAFMWLMRIHERAHRNNMLTQTLLWAYVCVC